MSLNSTPSGERIHIGFFGRRNTGKSSVVNAVTNQDIAVVSDVLGTTTDPVYKSMELLPLGPVMIIDTAGLDDTGKLGELRINQTMKVLNKTDIAILVTDSDILGEYEKNLIKLFKEKGTEYLIAVNKSDLLDEMPHNDKNKIYISAKSGYNIDRLKETIAHMIKTDNELNIVGDLIQPNDFIILVTPIDSSAPKGRMILPQQQVIRDILDFNACSIVVKETRLKYALENIGLKPSLVITDSQVFEKVSKEVPDDIPLTSFSILMARYKGFLDTAVDGVSKIDKLREGDRILISEGCSHHRQCEDIGTVKIPKWLREYTGKDFEFEFSSGTGFPENLKKYDLVIHCGGCMLNSREIQNRMEKAKSQGIPFTNYGTTIAFLKGILKRSLEIFPDISNKLQ